MVAQSGYAALNYRSSESGQPQCYPLSGRVIIGRDPACQLALDSSYYKGVSRQHAELTSMQGVSGQSQWQIRDLGSANGVFINGHQLQGVQVLRSGDRISLGRNSIEFIFEASPSKSITPPNATVYETAGVNSASPIPTTSNRSSHKVILGSLAGVAAIFLFLNSLQPKQPTASSTTEPSAPTQTDRNAVEVQGADLLTQYFKITEEKLAEDVPVTAPTGQETTIDAYLLVVEAKSTFSSAEVNFAVHFYNAAGTEISQPVPIVYEPAPEQWTAGTKGVAIFKLPSDRSNLKVIRISR